MAAVMEVMVVVDQEVAVVMMVMDSQLMVVVEKTEKR
jgi:hypothetical protein